eukprot:scaffold140316_cov130-Phaeocystis_antarctica.AAC.2
MEREALGTRVGACVSKGAWLGDQLGLDIVGGESDQGSRGVLIRDRAPAGHLGRTWCRRACRRSLSVARQGS